MIQSEWNVLKHIRFSVFPPFIEECDDTTTTSDNDKSDINNPNEIFYVKHEKTEENAKSEQRKNQKVKKPEIEFPKEGQGRSPKVQHPKSFRKWRLKGAENDSDDKAGVPSFHFLRILAFFKTVVVRNQGDCGGEDNQAALIQYCID